MRFVLAFPVGLGGANPIQKHQAANNVQGVVGDAGDDVALLDAGLVRRRVGLHVLDDEPALAVAGHGGAEVAGLAGLRAGGHLGGDGLVHGAVVGQVRLRVGGVCAM